MQVLAKFPKFGLEVFLFFACSIDRGLCLEIPSKITILSALCARADDVSNYGSFALFSLVKYSCRLPRRSDLFRSDFMHYCSAVESLYKLMVVDCPGLMGRAGVQYHNNTNKKTTFHISGRQRLSKTYLRSFSFGASLKKITN